jgi:hypothetical protein
MRGTRLARYLGAATFSACLLISGSATAFNGTVLRGFGTATIDGVMGAGEWDSAGRVDFTVNRSTSQGGGTVPATVYAMNDATNLYVGIKVTNATVGSSGAELFFDSDHNDSEVGEGEDSISVDGTGAFHDRFYRFDSPGWWLSEDTDYGGTDDGDERDADAIGFSFYEFSHPLDDADNAHDFSLAAVRAIGFKLRFRHCSPCAPHSYFHDRFGKPRGSRHPAHRRPGGGVNESLRGLVLRVHWQRRRAAVIAADLRMQGERGFLADVHEPAQARGDG